MGMRTNKCPKIYYMDEGQPKQNTVANGNGPIIHYYGQFPSFGPAGKRRRMRNLGWTLLEGPRGHLTAGEKKGKKKANWRVAKHWAKIGVVECKWWWKEGQGWRLSGYRRSVQFATITTLLPFHSKGKGKFSLGAVEGWGGGTGWAAGGEIV